MHTPSNDLLELELSLVPYTTEFMMFAVKRGAETRADEWMKVLTQRNAECVTSLDREHMHFESIFKSERADRTYLSWYSVQGESGAHVKNSPLEIDQIHMEFWRECIDPDVPPEKFKHVVNILPAEVAHAIEAREARLGTNAA